ncbi:glutamate--cysteine ligase [Porticoccaceae bacterium LTM1]|nr:glutamate--cysteine ligase [Porticoccaceae bacterium LTM1]
MKSLSQFQQRLALLSRPENNQLLAGVVRGIEKESLRVTPEGLLAKTPHPAALGSALTHPEITTDYSEALLEFITPPSGSVKHVYDNLEALHQYTYRQIGDELLWVNSMPCMLGHDNDTDIPEARYGSSNIGRMKRIYRIGLGHRYGRLMQTIAGIHYNFSLPDSFWKVLQQQDGDTGSLQDYKTTGYFSLIRNFRRNFWLLLYLFGASPAVCRSFVRNRNHSLEPVNCDDHSLHSPYATSLRMGDLGYQSKAQDSLVVCYNNLENYIETLRGALTTSYPGYEKIGLKDDQGNYRQLSNNLLQIENEFYSSIRPKRTAHSGEPPVAALWERGVEYIEVRCLDLNPLLPVGIEPMQMHFIDTFLVYCLLSDSPKTHTDEYHNILENQRRMVYRGREPGLMLRNNGGETPLKDWAQKLFDGMAPIAEMMDAASGGSEHSDALNHFGRRINQPELTPSSILLNELQSNCDTYFQTALGYARQHREYFLDKPLDPALDEQFRAQAAQSLEEQKHIEQSDKVPFEQFLAEFYQRYDFPLR